MSSFLKPVIIVGAGGHCVSVLDAAFSMKRKVIFIVDPNYEKPELMGVSVLPKIENIPQLGSVEFVVAIGNNELRKKLSENILETFPYANFGCVIHRTAYVSETSRLDNNSVILGNAFIGPEVTIGFGGIVNTGATIDHCCKIDKFVSISPGVNIGGDCVIEKSSFIGIGATISNGINIAAYTMVGAGAVVLSHTKENSLYVGIPATFKRHIQK